MKRIVVGVSGASGAPLAQRLLEELRGHDDVETHLVITYGGERTIQEECSITLEEFTGLADVVHDNHNIGASIASGTFQTEGMVIVPCSMKTISGIAHGFSENLILRAADVMIKEQRKLIIVPRESPLSKIHLDNMAYLATMPGVYILPPVISYYHHPETLRDVETQITGRILSRFGIEIEGFKRWK